MTKILMTIAAAIMALTAQGAAALTTFNFSFSGTTDTAQAFSGRGIFSVAAGGVTPLLDENEQPVAGVSVYSISGISGIVNLAGTESAIVDLVTVGDSVNAFLGAGNAFQLFQTAFVFGNERLAVFTLDQANLSRLPVGTMPDVTVDGTSFAISAIPEPATWGLMLTGFGLVGATLRRRRVSVRFA